MPRHLKKQLGVPVSSFVRQSYSLPLLLNLPLVGVVWLANRFFTPRNLIQMVMEIGAAFLIYGIGVLWAYKTVYSGSRSLGAPSSCSRLKLPPHP